MAADEKTPKAAASEKAKMTPATKPARPAPTERPATSLSKSGGITLITGASGFLGGHLVRLLCERGLGPVRAMQSGEPPGWMRRLEGVEIVRGSVLSADDVARALVGVDCIYHLAGLVSAKTADAHRMYQLHVDGTRLLCKAAAAAGVRRMVLS